MKRYLSVLLAMLLAMSFTAALAEQCKYGNAESPCDIIWYVNGETREHCRACRNHVENKEDPRSYVRLTEWAACTVPEGPGECAVCGMTYGGGESDDAINAEKYLKENFIASAMEAGVAPVDASVSGDTLEIGFAKYFRNTMMEKGYLTSESLAVASEYTLTLPGGTEYVFDGSPVIPGIKLNKTDYGSGVWLEQNGLLTVGDPVYDHNTAVGTGSVSVSFTVFGGKTYTLIKTFTIVKGAQRLPGDADGSKGVNISDAIAILRHMIEGDVNINQSNADVNGDKLVDLKDVLRILQYDAGWNVKLQ